MNTAQVFVGGGIGLVHKEQADVLAQTERSINIIEMRFLTPVKSTEIRGMDQTKIVSIMSNL